MTEKSFFSAFSLQTPHTAPPKLPRHPKAPDCRGARVIRLDAIVRFPLLPMGVRVPKKLPDGLSMTLFRSKNRITTFTGWPLLAGTAVLSLAGSGCHQRAYNELYVENMASEIRLLEDRIYEYDAEYRALESELEDLQAINEGLESRLREAEQDRSDRFSQPKSAPKSDSLQPAPAKPTPAKSAEPKQATPKPASPKPAAPKPSTPEPVAPEKESLRLPPNDIQLDVETPEPPPLKKPSTPDSGEVLPPKSNTTPTESLLPSSPLPALPGSPSPTPLLPNPKAPDSASTAPKGLPSAVARASYEERRIAAPSLPPATLTSAKTDRGSSNPGSSTPTDTRVRYIEFHPGLCRALRRDGNPTENGIALVLVPRNQKHEFIGSAGKITVVLEETVEGQSRRLGKWEYSAQETSELLEPVGSGQGIHLELPWQENTPQTNLIDVYVRFTDDQGITMVNHRQIHLRKPTPGQSTWTPK